ncbi:MAG: hypothetical protein EXQ47_07580 [Bryobacterales bacterium]|nr:hypothetical protein [Bryobacterales bacterium]
MKKLVVAMLFCGPAVVLRADFTYQETTQMTGGAMIGTLQALGPLTRAAPRASPSFPRTSSRATAWPASRKTARA